VIEGEKEERRWGGTRRGNNNCLYTTATPIDNTEHLNIKY
jgi:hypothetical protein